MVSPLKLQADSREKKKSPPPAILAIRRVVVSLGSRKEFGVVSSVTMLGSFCDGNRRLAGANAPASIA
jgi:hypothetical protein